MEENLREVSLRHRVGCVEGGRERETEHLGEEAVRNKEDSEFYNQLQDNDEINK